MFCLRPVEEVKSDMVLNFWMDEGGTEGMGENLPISFSEFWN